MIMVVPDKPSSILELYWYGTGTSQEAYSTYIHTEMNAHYESNLMNAYFKESCLQIMICRRGPDFTDWVQRWRGD